MKKTKAIPRGSSTPKFGTRLFFRDAKFHHAAPNFIIQRRIVDAEFVMQRRISSYSAESEIAPNSSADSDSALYDNHPAPNYSAELF